MKKQLFITCSTLLLSACSFSAISHGDYRYKGINFGSDRDADYKKGVRNACSTVDCGYTKDLNKLKNNESYRMGWEDGLFKCKGKSKEDQLHGF